MENETVEQDGAEALHDAAGEPVAAEAHETGELHATTEAHGGEEHVAFPPFNADSFGTQLIWLALTFAVLYFVLSRLALPRIGAILDDRKARLDADLSAAEASRQKTDAAIAAYEAALAEARGKAHTIAEETRESIRADIDAKRAVVEADLGAKISEAESRIQATKTEALGHVDEIASETVEAVVAQLTGAVSPTEARDAVARVTKE
jgi:F-type H+-transporting ATPase subunit b